MKFEEAFHSKQEINLPLYEINYVFIEQPKIFENEYRPFLFCPECHQARLAYKNAKTPYLSAYPGAIHSPDCDLAQDVVSHDEARSIVNDYNKNTDIQDSVIRQIDSTLRLLLAERNRQPLINNTSQQHRNNIHQQSEIHDGQHQENNPRLPRKRIDLTLNDTDYGVYKIFYGNVFLKWKKDTKSDEQKSNHKILLYTPKTHKFKCSIKITDNVYSYLPSEYKFINNQICKIVFIAELKKGYNLKTDNCAFATLINSQFLKISI